MRRRQEGTYCTQVWEPKTKNGSVGVRFFTEKSVGFGRGGGSKIYANRNRTVDR